MKIQNLLLLPLLAGCVETTNIDTTAYDRLTSGEKTMEKAFEAYDLIGGCNAIDPNDGNSIYSYKFGSIQNGDKRLYYSRDFAYRFTQPSDNLVETAKYVQLFDKDARLTDADRQCLTMNVEGKFVNNTDECLLNRRKLFADTDILTRCLYSYEEFDANFIPSYAGIRNESTFRGLKKAYNGSKSECKKKRERQEITEAELQQCLENVDAQLDEIVKSDIINGGYDVNFSYGDNLDEFLEHDKKEQSRQATITKIEEDNLKQQKIAAQQSAERKKKRAECLKNVNLCGNTKTKGCHISLPGKVVSITSKGVLTSIYNCPVCDTEYNFVYTDKEYLSDQQISRKYYLEYVGTYDYTDTLLNRRRVPAYKETTLPVCD